MSLLSYATQKVSPLTLIEGPFTDLNWASLGADYTLRALLESQKYCTVVVVAFDRPKEDIVSNAMDLKGENLGTEEKLRVIEALDVFSGGTSLSDVYEEISRIYLESKGDGMIAVLVYSISSVCLTMGWGNTKRFLDKLTAFVNNPVGTEETDGIVSRDFLGRGTVVGTINDSLHSRQQLAMLRREAERQEREKREADMARVAAEEKKRKEELKAKRRKEKEKALKKMIAENKKLEREKAKLVNLSQELSSLLESLAVCRMAQCT